jgi:hypothetical protein
VGGSGLIVVVIVAAWALFLVPQWLHRRAEAAARLADRVDAVDLDGATPHEAPAPLSRSRLGRRTLARRIGTVPASRRWWRGPTRRSERAPARNAHPARSAAARRRRILGLLALATLVAATAVGVGVLTGLPVPAWLVAVPGGLMVAYLLLLAVLRPGAPFAASRVAAPFVVDAEHGEEVEATPDDGATDADVPAAAAPLPAAGPERTWTPVPVPSPTYVTAPRARRVVRTIDLSNPGSWTASRDESSPEPASAGLLSGPEPDAEVVEHRRAVGD